MESPLLMTREEAAEKLSMSLSHFQRHVQSGMPCVRSGQLRLYRIADLENWIEDQLQSCPVPPRPTGIGSREAHDQFAVEFEDAHEKFIEDCRAGVALNNRGEPYKPKAIRSLDCALRRVPAPIRKRRLVDVTGGELQKAIDDYIREGLSGSRIHTIICAVRSLYTWAVHRGKAAASPATNLRLPAVTCEARDRVATPGGFAGLLDRIPDPDALAWALAGYGTARRQEIEALDWEDVDFTEDAVLLAGDDDARKSEAARRIVPMVSGLRARLHAEWVRQGRPRSGPVFAARRADNRTGTADLNATLRRIKKRWEDLGMEPITFQEVTSLQVV